MTRRIRMSVTIETIREAMGRIAPYIVRTPMPMLDILKEVKI